VVTFNRVTYLRQLDGTVYQVNPNGTWTRSPGFPGPFPVPSSTPPPAADHSLVVYAAFQPYEHGFMVWRSDTGTIYAFFGPPGGTFGTFLVSGYGSLPDNTVWTPPPGFVNPIIGFGRVWAYYGYVRARLGWATAPEQGYQTTIGLSQGTEVLLTLPDGRTVVFLPPDVWWLR
jgi:hypothetical protein